MMSLDSSSNYVSKQPLKRIEIHLHKFNDVAIPHHIDLLHKHKSNIQKFQENAEWERVHREQINATRLIKQLKALLYEMDMLRNQVFDSDLQKFDKLTASSRENALKAIEDYLAMNPQKTNLWISAEKSNEEEMESKSEINNSTNEISSSQLKLALRDDEVKKREECLKSWENLQAEVQDVHDLFQEFAKVVEEQKEKVEIIEENVEEAEENILEGANTLRRVSKYKTSIYPLAGALIGGCLGGPVGLFAGMKLGGLAALGCSVLGFTGGKFLKKKQEEENNHEIEMLHMTNESNMKGSTSLPVLQDTSREKTLEQQIR
ncbi:hypothetical protein R5R35_008601 [Gryllus longicercus]|uniref:t-SNARE coiled-coil homology domain-containing protein n=1 Tax=Gryllus longicercus TaxID=2509291 RepID=A0AAN9V398_9ORTH